MLRRSFARDYGHVFIVPENVDDFVSKIDAVVHATIEQFISDGGYRRKVDEDEMPFTLAAGVKVVAE